ncbi:MAG: hypothetical protein LBE75_06140 [Burkholderiales bacterium]|jgi:hypothetical protein|nr:hypothetical protein [Burkholderiales bacterium]
MKRFLPKILAVAVCLTVAFSVSTTASIAATIDGAIGYQIMTHQDSTIYFNGAEACAKAPNNANAEGWSYVGPHFFWHPEWAGGCRYTQLIMGATKIDNYFAQNWVVQVAVCPAGYTVVDAWLGEHPWVKCKPTN